MLHKSIKMFFLTITSCAIMPFTLHGAEMKMVTSRKAQLIDKLEKQGAQLTSSEKDRVVMTWSDYADFLQALIKRLSSKALLQGALGQATTFFRKGEIEEIAEEETGMSIPEKSETELKEMGQQSRNTNAPLVRMVQHELNKVRNKIKK